MRKSWIYKYGYILRFIPIFHIVILFRFSFLVSKGFFDRFRVTRKNFVLVLCILAVFLPIVIVDSCFDIPDVFMDIFYPFLGVVVVYLAVLWWSTFALREEKRVREEGYFWVEEDS